MLISPCSCVLPNLAVWCAQISCCRSDLGPVYRLQYILRLSQLQWHSSPRRIQGAGFTSNFYTRYDCPESPLKAKSKSSKSHIIFLQPWWLPLSIRLWRPLLSTQRETSCSVVIFAPALSIVLSLPPLRPWSHLLCARNSCAVFLKSPRWSAHRVFSYFYCSPDPACSQFPHRGSWSLRLLQRKSVGTSQRGCVGAVFSHQPACSGRCVLLPVSRVCSIKLGSLCIWAWLLFIHQLWQCCTIMGRFAAFHFLRLNQ